MSAPEKPPAEPVLEGFARLAGDPAAQAWLAALAEQLPCGLAVFDAHARLVLHNRLFRQLLDFPDALFAGGPPALADLVRFDAARGAYGPGPEEAAIQRVLAQAASTAAHQGTHERPGGGTLQVRRAPLPGGGWVATYADISAPAAAQRALRESEQARAHALDAARMALWHLDLRTGRLRLSEQWSEMLGGSREPTQTTIQAFIALAPADEQQQLNDALVALLQGHADHATREHRVRRADGSLLWLRSEARVTGRDADGRAVRATGSLQDITSRKAVQAELAQATEAAAAAGQAKTEFLDNVSHEIRTPINGMLGMTRLLKAQPLTTQQRKYVQIAEANAASLLELVNDLLDLGKMEAGGFALEEVPFALREVVADLATAYAQQARDKNLHFAVEVAPDVPHEVAGDPVRLRQILGNLLSNALKFTATGEVGLLVARADAGRGPHMLLFTVYDTGIGISPQVQQRLFSRFTQADASTTRRFGGTGVGLAIVKELCERMGGTVLLQSEPGRGASFRCELPLRPVSGDTLPPQPAPLPTAARPLRLLVAEDNPTNQIVVRGLLEQAGHTEVAVVADGRAAVQAALAEAFDAVLMDCHMPVMDGYEATRRLREAGCGVPIIAVTANASPAERERCLALGMDDYLTKPLDGARLAQALARWSRVGSPAAPPAPPPAPPPAEPTAEPGPEAEPAADAGAGAGAGAGAPTDGFDRALALQRLGGDEELLGAALGAFRQHTPALLDKLRSALEAGDAPQAHRHLHSLAGSTSMVGAEPLHQLARQLEAAAAAGTLQTVAQALPALAAEFERFVLQSEP